MCISSSEAMTNTDLSYLYRAVSALGSAMSVMLMASWFASELTERKRMHASRMSISITPLTSYRSRQGREWGSA